MVGEKRKVVLRWMEHLACGLQIFHPTDRRAGKKDKRAGNEGPFTYDVNKNLGFFDRLLLVTVPFTQPIGTIICF